MYNKYIITGCAGFIGFHLAKSLLELDKEIFAIDNLNEYYDKSLKVNRIYNLKKYTKFTFIQMDITSKEELMNCFEEIRPDCVINLAAQAGVRNSIENPDEYINSNIIGFFNILECCRRYPIKHLLYASSSSVYGQNEKVPYSTEDKTDKPISLYAATKKSNELMAYTYSQLYNIPSTGMRFFTVYGPFGRPDMAYYSFTQKILNGRKIKIFNNGNLFRDYTYIDDIVEAIKKIIPKVPEPDAIGARYKLYNIGNSKPESLLDFIKILESCLEKKADIEFLPMQPGDVYQTFADVTELENDFGFKPQTSLNDGLGHFVKWYKSYYDV